MLSLKNMSYMYISCFMMIHKLCTKNIIPTSFHHTSTFSANKSNLPCSQSLLSSCHYALKLDYKVDWPVANFSGFPKPCHSQQMRMMKKTRVKANPGMWHPTLQSPTHPPGSPSLPEWTVRSDPDLSARARWSSSLFRSFIPGHAWQMYCRVLGHAKGLFQAFCSLIWLLACFKTK